MSPVREMAPTITVPAISGAGATVGSIPITGAGFVVAGSDAGSGARDGGATRSSVVCAAAGWALATHAIADNAHSTNGRLTRILLPDAPFLPFKSLQNGQNLPGFLTLSPKFVAKPGLLS